MLRLLQKPIYSFGFVLLSAVIPVWWLLRLSPAPSLATEISGKEKHVMMIRAGLDANSMAAAGVGSNSIAATLQGLNTYLASNPSALANADAAVASARVETDRLVRLIQSGKASEPDVTQHQAAQAALATATSQQASALNAIFAAATANLSEQQLATLASIRSNSANSDVPVEFRTLNRSKADWMQLRDDLSAERTLAAHGESPYAPGAERLAIARANQTVAAAKTALTTNLAAVTTALNTALSGQ